MTAIRLPMRPGESRSHSLAPCCSATCAEVARTRACKVHRSRDVDVRARTPMRPHGGRDAVSTPRCIAVRCDAPRAGPPSLAPT
jgi:hypothetical protein